MKKIRRIYVAGPISAPQHKQRRANCIRALRIADKIMDLGLKPFVPHLDFWWNEISPKDYETWLNWDFSFLEVCEALYRMRGRSPGADREVAYAIGLGKPVFYSLKDLKKALKKQKGK